MSLIGTVLLLCAAQSTHAHMGESAWLQQLFQVRAAVKIPHESVMRSSQGLERCRPAEGRRPAEEGLATIERSDDSLARIYWMKFSAARSPSRGALFYLAGGPVPAYLYPDMAVYFQGLAYPDLDVYLYDYPGTNCSGLLRSVDELRGSYRYLTMSGMAKDFIQLKRHLIGERQAYLMGGSHGAMLGAQIVAEYPEHIRKAVLFAGDTESGWLRSGWLRFDGVLQSLASQNPDFVGDLDRLLEMAERGTLVVEGEPPLSRDEFEIGLWMIASQDAARQLGLGREFRTTVEGGTDLLLEIRANHDGLLAPLPAQEPPTLVSALTNFHRCTVWFPRSARVAAAGAPGRGRFLRESSLIGFWNKLCGDYDELGEYPLNATPTRPTVVPVLAWIGDRDYFDPEASRARWSRLSSELRFHVMPGWSHDFGPDNAAGLETAAGLVRDFLRGH